MADVKRYIEIVFNAVDNSGSALASLGSGLKNIENNIGQVTGPMQSATEKILAFDVAVTGAAAAIIAFSLKAASEFDTSFREISTLTDQSEEQLKGFRDQVLTAAGESSGSFDQFTKSIYDSVSAGVKLEDSIKFVSDAERLAIGGRADLSATTNLLVTSLNAYSKGTGDAAHFSDDLFQAVKIGVTTIPELTSVLGRVSPTAAAAGVSFDDLSATIGILTKNGIKTEEAVTGFKAALSNIISPSTEASKLAKELGVDFTAQGLAASGLGNFMALLNEKTGGNISTMGKLFGSTEALNTVMVLSRGSASELKGAIELMGNAAGSTDEAYKKMAGSIPIQTNIMFNALKVAGVAIGDALLAPFAGLESGATAVFKSIAVSAKDGAFKPLQDLVITAFNEIEVFLKGVAKSLPEALANVDFQGLTSALKNLAQAIGASFSGIDITTPQGLASGIQFLVDAITDLVKTTTGIANLFSLIVQGVTAVLPASGALRSSIFEVGGVMLALGTSINILIPAIKLLGSGIFSVGTAIDGAGGLLTGLSKLGTMVAGLATGPAGIAILALSLLAVGDHFLTGGKGAEFLTNALKQGANAVADFTGLNKVLQPEAAHTATEVGFLAASMFESAKASTEAAISSARVGDEQKKLFPLIFTTTQAWDEQTNTQLQWSTVNESLAASLKKINTEAQDYAVALRGVNVNTDLANKGFTDLDGFITNVTPLFGKLNKEAPPAMTATAKETLKATESAEKFNLEWAKLAEQEREVIFKASADIAVASIQAQSAQVVAAFDSIGQTVQSTSDLIGSLATSLTQVQSDSTAGRAILSLLEEQSKNQAQALELQKQLVQSQIKVLDAQAERLNSGDAFITVTADGLEPELEAFMFKILERVQIKASAEAQSFLLGLNA